MPPSELRNTKIQHAATPKTAGTRINTKHTPSHKEITNAHEDALPSIIADSQCLHAASPGHAVYGRQAPRRHATIPHLMPGFHGESCCSTRRRGPTARLTARLSRQPPSKWRHRRSTFPRRRTRKEEAASNLQRLPCGADWCVFRSTAGAAFELTADQFLHHLYGRRISIVCLKSPFSN